MTDSKTPELKPCPFCGGEPTMNAISDDAWCPLHTQSMRTTVWNLRAAESRERMVLVPREPTDNAILMIVISECDTLDITRAHEMREGNWHTTTIFDGDAGLVRVVRKAMLAAAGKEKP